MDPFASFAQSTDRRVQGRCLHQLVGIVALLLCGTLAGCDDLPEICDYGRALLDACPAGSGLCARGLVETERHTSQGLAHTLRFYLRSLTDPDPAMYARLIRGHWAVENRLYWHLDLACKEDRSRLRTGHAVLNANILRKTALYLLAQDPQPISRKRKRKQAAYDNEHLRQLLRNA